MGVLRIVSLAGGGLIAAGVIFLVANTIKLTIYARRDEVEVLSILGATPSFIRTPFVLEGMIQGDSERRRPWLSSPSSSGGSITSWGGPRTSWWEAFGSSISLSPQPPASSFSESPWDGSEAGSRPDAFSRNDRAPAHRASRSGPPPAGGRLRVLPAFPQEEAGRDPEADPRRDPEGPRSRPPGTLDRGPDGRDRAGPEREGEGALLHPATDGGGAEGIQPAQAGAVRVREEARSRRGFSPLACGRSTRAIARAPPRPSFRRLTSKPACAA